MSRIQFSMEQKTRADMVQHGVQYSSALGAIQFSMGSIIQFIMEHNTVKH
jgi:hypothetical protein